MGGFEHLLQAVKQQQQLMEELEAENQELRRQLTELREGRGIYLDINGQRFALSVDGIIAEASSSTFAPVVTIEATEAEAEVEEVSLAEYNVVPQQVEEEAVAEEELPALSAAPKTPFLEEIMINEFAAQTTSPISVWNGPVKEKSLESIDEEQKAALRQALSGSYILE
jgi:hypothetical protein